MGSKGGGGSAPSPDPNIGKAALKNAQLGEDWLNFSKQQMGVANERQATIDKLTNRVTEQQLATQDQANAWAKEDRGRYTSTFRPIEDKYISDATSWDSPERQAAMAAEAKADVMGAADQQRQISNRQMSAMGVNPNSGRFAGSTRAGNTATALNAAGAQNQARNTVRQQGMAMRADVANMGKGLPSQAASSSSLGLSAGNSAVGNTLSANGAWQNSNNIMNSGYGGAMQGNSSSASILNQKYGNELNSWSAENSAGAANSAGMWGGIGSMAGMAMMAFSSKELKENKKPVRGALQAIKSMPVESWDYKEGVSDGGSHVGPYAEDFQKATGLGDGTMINMVDAMGVSMKATQELDDKVEKLARGIEVMSKKINPPKKGARGVAA